MNSNPTDKEMVLQAEKEMSEYLKETRENNYRLCGYVASPNNKACIVMANGETLIHDRNNKKISLLDRNNNVVKSESLGLSRTLSYIRE